LLALSTNPATPLGAPPLAAAGLLLTMLSAAVVHIGIGEAHVIAPPIVLGALATFIAWGRYKRHPIGAK
jgi:putative oxidoreductase